MGSPSEPSPVKLFFAILFSDEEKLFEAIKFISEKNGEIDFKSMPLDFDETDYYKQEMGENIKRIFISIKKLIKPDEIVDIKKQSTELENILSVDGKRKVNIDPGYMDFSKLVLATYKGGGCKIYIRDGVWIDIMLRYEKGSFQSFPWTFPDFAKGKYFPILLSIRKIYKLQMKEIRSKIL